MNVIILM